MRHAVRAIGFAMVFPLAACDNSPTMPATDDGVVPDFAILENDRNPFSASLFVCTEVVDFTGEFHVKTSFTSSASGNEHFTFHINAKGTGVGQTSGATYQWNDNIVEVVNDADLPFTLTELQTWKLIGQGAADNFLLKQRFHVTVNANGDVTVVHDTFEVTCK
jgi:hypothetical protein